MWDVATMSERSLAALLFVALSCGAIASVDDGRTSVDLSYNPSRFSLSHGVTLEGKEVAFVREPDFGDHDVIRSVLATGKGSEDFVGFAWDETGSVLYLDLNRDLDLTNDPDGVLECGSEHYVQRFDGIGLELEHDGIRVPYVLDMMLYTFSRPHLYGQATIRSGWEGELSLHGRTWSFTVVDNLDGVINHEDRFTLTPSGPGHTPLQPQAEDVRAASRIFLDGRAYDLTFAFEEREGECHLAAVFEEAQTSMGTLGIQGSSVARLILVPAEAGPGHYLVVADSPGASLPVPAGQYSGGLLYLAAEGSSQTFQADLPALSVPDGGQAALAAGGPLQHSVTVERRGPNLEMEYCLVGVGNEEYEIHLRNREDSPRFRILHEGREVGSDQFEYG